ncbi:MAG: AmmeMemoRadiSam system radical SAM enzyme [bacterium]
MKITAFLLAAVFALLSLGASALIAFSPPPATFSRIMPAENPWIRTARFWHPVCNGVRCNLCPFRCFLPEGARGICKVRLNSGGMLKTMVYGKPVSVHIDPIEKKPVYHLLPGSLIYSLATPGCNLSCKGCQNWEISQIFPEQASSTTVVPSALEIVRGPDGRLMGQVRQDEVSFFPPEKIVEYALATKSRSIAYTYSEPAVFYEYMYDTARLAKEKGLKNVAVSAGYINPEPLRALLPYMDVVKIDLKGFNKDFYRKYSGGELEPVKETLLTLKKSNAMFEVVNLVIPSLNDSTESLKSLSAWIMKNLGADTPLFFSRFGPNYRMQNLPATPAETLTQARDIAVKEGLHYVYAGNAPGHPGESTYCPKCHRVLIKRYGYAILADLITHNNGKCPYDGTKIPGIWK